jgi:hypothetical protein
MELQYLGGVFHRHRLTNDEENPLALVTKDFLRRRRTCGADQGLVEFLVDKARKPGLLVGS